MKTTHRSIASLTLLALTVALVATPSALAVDEGWTVSFAEAKAEAAKTGKSILMEFTGSDWCPPCIKLHKTVLVTDVFKTEAPKHFILLKLDNPRDKSKQSMDEISQYRKLSAQYKITGVPTVILADEQGRPYHRQVGFSGDPAEKWVGDLAAKSTILAERNEFLSKADQADGVERAKLLDQAISLIDSELAIGTYKDMIAEIITLDADGAAGLKPKYEGAVQTAEIKSELQKIQQTLRNSTPEEVLVKINALLEEKKPTGEGLQQALYLKSMITYRTDKDAAKVILLEARAAAPTSKMATGQIDRVLQQVFKVEPKK